MTIPWSHTLAIGAPPAGGMEVTLTADDAARVRIAQALDLLALDDLSATVLVKPWFDGVEITGAWNARVAQTCGVTLERLDSALSGSFTVRAVPPQSLHAPDPDSEIDVDPDADDPPDVAEDGVVDLAHYVVEHLALEIDPFPRKPGAEFTPPPDSGELSPFAVLRKLRPNDPPAD